MCVYAYVCVCARARACVMCRLTTPSSRDDDNTQGPSRRKRHHGRSVQSVGRTGHVMYSTSVLFFSYFLLVLLPLGSAYAQGDDGRSGLVCP